MPYTHIIWDFNGTILGDVDIAVASVNDMLRKRGMAETDRQVYLKTITSPIIDYYRTLFDLDIVPFDDIQVEYLEGYEKRLGEADLLPGVREALDRFDQMGLRQCVISSFEQGRLGQMIESFGIARYFDSISGADNTRAEGKVERGLDWLRASGADPEKVLVIGDLDHDWELSRVLGAHCILIAAGHQHRNALEKCGVPVYDSLLELPAELFEITGVE